MNKIIKMILETVLVLVIGFFGSYLILHGAKDFLTESGTSFLHDLTSCINFSSGILFWIWNILVLMNLLKKNHKDE